jgi:hypothetical protein
MKHILRSTSALVALVAVAHVAAAQGTPVLAIDDSRARAAVEREIAQAAERGLPTRPLIAKAREGVTKRASGTAIREAVARQARRLAQARDLLAPSTSEAEIVAGADALANGVPPAMLRQVRAAYPAGQSVAMPLDVLTELVARGVPAKHALEQITLLMRRGATPAQIASLGASVQSDVAAGLTPDAALEVRARGVMSLLSAPSQSLGAPNPRLP